MEAVSARQLFGFNRGNRIEFHRGGERKQQRGMMTAHQADLTSVGVMMAVIGMRALKTPGWAGVAGREIGQVAGDEQTYVDDEIRHETQYACLALVHFCIGLSKALAQSAPVTA